MDLKYYQDKGVKKGELYAINQEMRCSKDELRPSAFWSRRLAALQEAIAWDKGRSQKSRATTELYKCKGYTIAVAKPGKEADPNYTGLKNYVTGRKAVNHNDMLPLILKKGVPHEEKWTFTDMFESIEHLMHEDLFGLEILGMLIFRAAFMLDHEEVDEGKWRYKLPKTSTKILEKRIPRISGMPTRTLLHFLEVLSLNEDVKIHTLGYTHFRNKNNNRVNYGRINTLLTFAHLIAVFLERRSISKFAGSLARPPSGMAPLPKTKASEFFPLLSPDWQ